MSLERLETLIHLFARAGTWLGGTLMVLAAFIIALEVILRKIFLVSLGGADELASYALAIGTVWALSFALIERAHIRVDALYMILPAPLCVVLDLLSLASISTVAALLSWYAHGVLMTSIELGATANTPLATPLWIPQGIWVIGLFSFLITAVCLFVLTALAAVKGNTRKVQNLAGTKTVNEELEEGLAAVQSGKEAPLCS